MSCLALHKSRQHCKNKCWGNHSSTMFSESKYIQETLSLLICKSTLSTMSKIWLIRQHMLWKDCMTLPKLIMEYSVNLHNNMFLLPSTTNLQTFLNLLLFLRNKYIRKHTYNRMHIHCSSNSVLNLKCCLPSVQIWTSQSTILDLSINWILFRALNKTPS